MKRINGAIARVTVKPKTLDKLNALRYGLRLTQDQVIDWLIRNVMLPDENPYDAGDRLYTEWQDDQHNTSEDIPL